MASKQIKIYEIYTTQDVQIKQKKKKKKWKTHDGKKAKQRYLQIEATTGT